MRGDSLVENCSYWSAELWQKFLKNILGNVIRNTTGLLGTKKLLVDLMNKIGRVIARISIKFYSDTFRQCLNRERFIFLADFTKKVSNHFGRFKFRQTTFNMFRKIEGF